MESSIVTDSRFRLLALDLGISFRETVGSLFLLWLACYERRTASLSKREANASAEVAGFAEALIAVGLADDCGDSVRIHGADERIEFLQKQGERGRLGGKKGQGKRRNRPRKANAKHPHAGAKSVGLAKPLTPTLTPALALALPPQPPEEEAIELFVEGWKKYFERRIDPASPSLLSLISEALKAGYTPWELRGAAWGCHRACCHSPEVLANCTPKTALRLRSRDGKNCLPDWLERANSEYPELHPGKPPPWSRLPATDPPPVAEERTGDLSLWGGRE